MFKILSATLADQTWIQNKRMLDQGMRQSDRLLPTAVFVHFRPMLSLAGLGQPPTSGRESSNILRIQRGTLHLENLAVNAEWSNSNLRNTKLKQ